MSLGRCSRRTRGSEHASPLCLDATSGLLLVALSPLLSSPPSPPSSLPSLLSALLLEEFLRSVSLSPLPPPPSFPPPSPDPFSLPHSACFPFSRCFRIRGQEYLASQAALKPAPPTKTDRDVIKPGAGAEPGEKIESEGRSWWGGKKHRGHHGGNAATPGRVEEGKGGGQREVEMDPVGGTEQGRVKR